jgi:TRAP-type transport system small permease protein
MTTRLSKLLDVTIQTAAGTMLLVLLGSVTAGIVSRAVERPLIWTDEAAGYQMVWLAVFGWMIATRRGAHIRIRFFFGMMPKSGRRLLETAFQLATGLLGLAIALLAFTLVRSNLDVPAITLPLSTAWLYAPLIPAGLLTTGQALADLIAAWREDDARFVQSPASAGVSR